MTAQLLKRIFRRGCIPLALLAFVFGLPVNSQILPDAPIEGVTVTIFSDEGYKLWNLQGSSVAYNEAGGVEVKEMDLEIYQGQEEKEIDMHIVGAQALYESENQTVAGEGGVFVDGDFYDIEGDNWKYSQDERIVQVTSNVKVVIDYELEAFLK